MADLWILAGLTPSSDTHPRHGIPPRRQEPLEIVAADRDAKGIDIGMEDQPLGAAKIHVDDHSYAVARIVNQAEWRHLPWRDAERGHQPLG